jgi:CheY-like chemotaxis protein
MSEDKDNQAIESNPGPRGVNELARVLIAEDDEELRVLLSGALRRGGYQVIECADGLELMEHVTSLVGDRVCQHVDLIISDVRMPWVTGLEALRCTQDYIGYPPFVLITAFADEETRAKAMQLGAASMLSKPFELDYFVEVVRAFTPPRVAAPQ